MVEPDLLPDVDIEQLLHEHGRIMSVPSGTHLFTPGTACSHFLVLQEGRVQVRMVSLSGREIVLYRLGPGETCIMTTACLMAHEPYPAEGFTETACRALVLTQEKFDSLIAASAPFRRFVFREHGRRLRAMMMALDEAIFQRLDLRLAMLLSRSATSHLQMTHQAIADELGTAREVISRLMKEMEKHGWLKLGRGSIEILDRNALLKLADPKFSSVL